jgi:glycosyltransferase involved in cell wall biosynthesis
MISVIIPVHNSTKTLERCIDSVLNQTYKDLEVLCIENGSSDDSWDLIEKYEKLDCRIKGHNLIHVSSVSQARNKGLHEAQGEYITFLDSDDWIEYNYLDMMVSS